MSRHSPATAHRTRALAILKDLVAFRSISSQSNLDLVDYISARLGDCDAHLSLSHDETGGKVNVFATVGPRRDGGIVLAGHGDVVPAIGDWSTDPFDAVVSDGRVYGRGTADMKGFLACVLAMAPLFAGAGLKRPLHLAITYDEEVGCRGAQVLLDTLARDGVHPALCIVGEPTSMRVVDAHKGCFEYTTAFTGLPGHGATPDAGVNAIHYAARFAAFLLDLADRLKARAPAGSPFDPPWSTIQIGTIDGGEARNIIAEHCRVEWELRPVSRADADFVRDAVRAHLHDELLPAMRACFPEARVETEVVGEVGGLEPAKETRVSQLVRRLNGGLAAPPAAFGTEAGLYQAAGMETVLCGPGSIEQAHTIDEFIEIDQIDRCLSVIGGLIGELEQ